MIALDIRAIFCAASLTLAFILANSLPNLAQTGLQQNLAIASIDGVRDVGPMAFEIVVTLQNESKAVLRLNASALRELTRQLNRIVVLDDK